MKLTQIIILLVSLYTTNILAQNLSANPACKDIYLEKGLLTISQFEWKPGVCLCNITSFQDSFGLLYRSFITFELGHFMIFISTEDSTDELLATGARNFYLFPRKTTPQITVLDTDLNDVTLKLPSEHSLIFNSSTGHVAYMENGAIMEDPAINLDNRGGIEITSFKNGILLDCGWARGKDSRSNQNGTAKFIDNKQAVCVVKNSEIFNYKDGEPTFKFATDSALATFLQRRCANIDRTSLK